MTKQDAKILERMFDAEFQIRLPCQLKSKHLERLASEGLIERMEVTLPGRFPVRISGWKLTLKGNYAYCEWAAEQYNEPPRSPAL